MIHSLACDCSLVSNKGQFNTLERGGGGGGHAAQSLLNTGREEEGGKGDHLRSPLMGACRQ